MPSANLLSQTASEGSREVCGRRVRAVFFWFVFFGRPKKMNPSYGGGTPLSRASPSGDPDYDAAAFLPAAGINRISANAERSAVKNLCSSSR